MDLTEEDDCKSNDAVEMEAEDGACENNETEHLTYDESAYVMYHQAQTGINDIKCWYIKSRFD